jgi:hypothetical protein
VSCLNIGYPKNSWFVDVHWCSLPLFIGVYCHFGLCPIEPHLVTMGQPVNHYQVVWGFGNPEFPVWENCHFGVTWRNQKFNDWLIICGNNKGYWRSMIVAYDMWVFLAKQFIWFVVNPLFRYHIISSGVDNNIGNSAPVSQSCHWSNGNRWGYHQQIWDVHQRFG